MSAITSTAPLPAILKVYWSNFIIDTAAFSSVRTRHIKDMLQKLNWSQLATWQGWRAIVFQRPLIQRTRLIENYANRKPGLVRRETKISWKGLSSLINWITVGNRGEGWQGCMEAQNLSGNFSCLFKSKKNSRRKEAVSLFAKMSPAVKQASTIQDLLIT